MKKYFIHSLLLALGLLGSFAPIANAQAVGLDKIVAVVNDEAITMSEYQTALKREQINGTISEDVSPKQIHDELLQRIIEERIMVQIARNQGIMVDEQEVDLIVQDIANRNGVSVPGLYAQLKTEGIITKEFRANLAEQRLVQKMVDAVINSAIVITDQEVSDHLQSHRDLYSTKESYEISHLYISTADMEQDAIERQRENILNIKNALDEEMRFEKAVNDYSDGEEGKTKGYIGWREDNQLPNPFLQALRETTIGGVSEIIETDNGFHILKMHDKKGDLKIVTQHLVRHILVQPEKRILSEQESLSLLEDIKAQLLAGEDFARLARINSDDESSAAAGGNLGWVNPGDTVPDFEQVMRKMDLNTISNPFRTQYGFHLLEVIDKREKDISRDLARQSAYSEIFRRKSDETFKNWFNRVKDGAYVELFEIEDVENG